MNSDILKITKEINANICKSRVLYQEWAQNHDINYYEQCVLYSLFTSINEGITQKNIAQNNAFPKQTVNNIISNLKKKGYVELTVSKDDKREKKVKLTVTGQSYAESILLELFEKEERVIQAMGETLVTQYAKATWEYYALLEKEMKTILITGASSGIGKETAKLFAAKGWHVIATMRKPEEEKELTKFDHITLMKLDITVQEDIDRVSKEVISQGGLDVLYNNAGYGMKGALETIPEDNLRRLFETDMMGMIRLTQAFIPYFKEKRDGLLLTTTSLAGIISFPLDSVYNCAKRGIEGLCEALYYELRPYNIKVKTIVPGAIKTNFKMETYNHEAYTTAAKNLSKVLIPDLETFPAPDEVANIAYEAATDGTDTFHYIVGKAAKNLYKKRQEMGLEEFKHYFYDILYKE